MASAAAAVAACKSASSAPEKYSSSGCANQRARQVSTAASTGAGVAPKLPWFSRAMPGAWWSKSDANAGALARVNDDEVAALLERAARALDNDGIRIDAGAELVHSGAAEWQCFRALRPPPTRRRGTPARIRLFKNNYTSSDGRTSGSSSAPSVLSVGRSSTVTAGLEGVSGGDGGSSRGTATGPGEISHVATL